VRPGQRRGPQGAARPQPPAAPPCVQRPPPPPPTRREHPPATACLRAAPASFPIGPHRSPSAGPNAPRRSTHHHIHQGTPEDSPIPRSPLLPLHLHSVRAPAGGRAATPQPSPTFGPPHLAPRRGLPRTPTAPRHTPPARARASLLTIGCAKGGLGFPLLQNSRGFETVGTPRGLLEPQNNATAPRPPRPPPLQKGRLQSAAAAGALKHLRLLTPTFSHLAAPTSPLVQTPTSHFLTQPTGDKRACPGCLDGAQHPAPPVGVK
jgi:hypothetical protein